MPENLQPPSLISRVSALSRWRGELAPQISHPSIRWVFMVTRLSVEAGGAFQVMTQFAGEIPEEHRPIFDGARRRLLAYMQAVA